MTKRARKKPKASPQQASAARRKSRALGPASDIGPLIERVVAIIEEAQVRVVRTVNSTMVLAYWHIGREIVEFVQGGSPRAEYGEQVLEELSGNLLARLGRGYSVRNLRYFRSFYVTYADRSPSIVDATSEFGTSLVPELQGSSTLGRERDRRIAESIMDAQDMQKNRRAPGRRGRR